MLSTVLPERRDCLGFHRLRQVEQGVVTLHVNPLRAHALLEDLGLINGLSGFCNLIGMLEPISAYYIHNGQASIGPSGDSL